jgi:hypothetical protein
VSNNIRQNNGVKMKKNHLIIWLLCSVVLFAQYNPDNHVVTTSMYYLKVNEDGSADELNKLMEDEFKKMNRVDKQLVSLMVLGHSITGSWNEIVQVAEWKSIADADKSTVDTGLLRKKARPNDKKRKAFYEKYGKYWSSKHKDIGMDELVINRVKRNKKRMDENTIVTVQEFYMKPMSQVEGGTVKEREALFDEYHNKVIMKNDKILSRKELRHYWSGSLGGGTNPFVIMTEFANIDDMINRTSDGRKTSQKAWPDDDDRSAFFEKRNKYLVPGHKDIAIHSNMVKHKK